MSSTQRLMNFAADVAGGAIKIVDLTQTLFKDTPVLVLPPQFGQCAVAPPLKIRDGSGSPLRVLALVAGN